SFALTVDPRLSYSFPTRRSSDLIASLRTAVREHPGTGAVIVPNFSLGSVLGTAFSAIAARYFDAVEIIEAHHAGKVDSPSGTARSEEHTSELQSRENLVCRLLLE